MKVALVFVVVAVCLAVASAALTCMGDENKCAENECCIRVTNLMARCAKKKDLDDKCEVNQLKMIFPKHVYRVMCPCQDGMKCVGKDGIIGKQIGTCQVDDDSER